jgi:hypothetical protein
LGFIPQPNLQSWLRDRKHRINVKQKADVGFPSLTQPTRYAIALQLLTTLTNKADVLLQVFPLLHRKLN